MTRIVVDGDRCVGSGACEASAPDVFRVGDDGMVVVVRAEPAAGELPDVEAAVRSCPAGALGLEAEQAAPAAG